jgi:transposase, IS5 family
VKLKAKADSYVVKSNVHFPTDINLLCDAVRKIITLTARASNKLQYSSWRQSVHNLVKVKTLLRKITRMKHSTSRNEEKRKEREALIVEAYKTYMNVSAEYVAKAESTISDIRSGKIYNSKVSVTDYVVAYAL